MFVPLIDQVTGNLLSQSHCSDWSCLLRELSPAQRKILCLYKDKYLFLLCFYYAVIIGEMAGNKTAKDDATKVMVSILIPLPHGRPGVCGKLMNVYELQCRRSASLTTRGALK